MSADKDRADRAKISVSSRLSTTATRLSLLLYLIIAIAGTGGKTWAACKLEKIDLPVTIAGRRALIPAQINGKEANFILDSGAFFSLITPQIAAKYSLQSNPIPYGTFISGLTGDASARVATVNVFTLAATPIRNVQFLVTGGNLGEISAGVLGQNFLGQWDVDYDLETAWFG